MSKTTIPQNWKKDYMDPENIRARMSPVQESTLKSGRSKETDIDATLTFLMHPFLITVTGWCHNIYVCDFF